MSTTAVVVTALGALVGAAGWLWGRVRGRRADPPRPVNEAEARYVRDGGDATYGFDRSHGSWVGLP